MSINASGRVNLPNEIQNKPTQSGNVDASHIICGANGNPDEIEIKGSITFNPPLDLNVSKIEAADNTSSITCLTDKSVVVGELDLGDNTISNLADPVDDKDAVNKQYLSGLFGDYYTKTEIDTDFYTKTAVDNGFYANNVRLNQILVANDYIDAGNNQIINLTTPTDGTMAANKYYCDALTGAIDTNLQTNYYTITQSNSVYQTLAAMSQYYTIAQLETYLLNHYYTQT